MICPKCGETNKESAKYCFKCGTKLPQEAVDSSGKRIILIVIGIVVILCGIITALLFCSKKEEKCKLPLPNESIEEQNKLEDEGDWESIEEAYIDYLKKNGSYHYFDYKDINNDGIPELLAAEQLTDDYSDDYPEDALLVKNADVYTYDIEEGVVDVGFIDSQTPLKGKEGDNWVRATGSGSGTSQLIFYTLNQDGNLEMISLIENLDTGKATYEILDFPDMTKNDSEVSVEQAETIRELWEDSYYIYFSVFETDDEYYSGEDEDVSTYLDYGVCLDPDDYVYGEGQTEDYYFYYPEDLYPYNNVTEEGVYFFSDEVDSASFERVENIENSAVDALSSAINEYSLELDNVEVLLQEDEIKEDGLVHGAVCGTGAQGEYSYFAISCNDNYVYIMSIYASYTDNSEEENLINYYIECMYRFCSFTRDVGEPRSYVEYLEEYGE